MTIIARYDELRIPEYALPYLVIGDDSGLTPEDKTTIDGYMAPYYEQAKREGGLVDFHHGAGEGSFTHSPAFGLACNCVECSILIVK